MTKSKDVIEFNTVAKIDEHGSLQWEITVLAKAAIITDEFTEMLWDQFFLEIEEEKE